MVRVAGEGAAVVEGDTKSGKPRLVDLDGLTAVVLRARRRERGALALQLARDDALVFGGIEGQHRNPEHVSRQFARDVERARAALGDDAVPWIRLHDLRHTHATILQGRGVASGATFGTSREHALPAAQRAALRRPSACPGAVRLR
jgi:integrase